MNDRDVVLVSAVRTPIGKIMGSLSSFKAPQLGGFSIKEALARAGHVELAAAQPLAADWRAPAPAVTVPVLAGASTR